MRLTLGQIRNVGSQIELLACLGQLKTVELSRIKEKEDRLNLRGNASDLNGDPRLVGIVICRPNG